MTRRLYLLLRSLLALPVQVFAQGDHFILKLQQPIAGKPVMAQLICDGTISSAECYREASKTALEIKRAD